ncbi:MAG: AAA family ATPase [Candidatus Paceibacterota bacterium]|jgi:ATP-dependent Clp protease ATP-binding subunit ClpC
MFDLEKSQISKAIFIEKYFFPGALNFFKVIFAAGFIYLSAVYFSYPFLGPVPFSKEFILKGALILFSLWGWLWLFLSFFNQKLKEPAMKESDNLADLLDLNAAKALTKAIHSKKYSFDLSLFLALAAMPEFKLAFSRLLLSREKIYKTAQEVWGKERAGQGGRAEEAEKIVMSALKIAVSQDLERISAACLLFAVIEDNPLAKKTLFELGVSKNDVLETVLWQERALRSQKIRKKFWLKENLIRKDSIGRHWAAGHTYYLNLYSRDLTNFKKNLPSLGILLHEKQIKQLEDALIGSGGTTSALLVGEPGTGRRMLLSNLANKVSEGRSYRTLNFSRVVEIDMPSVIASAQNIEDLGNTLRLIFNEAMRAGNVILVIREIHNYIGSHFGAREIAKVNISGVLSEYVSHPGFRLIGITTSEGFNHVWHQTKEALTHFTKVEVPEAAAKETLAVLEEASLEIERQTKFLVTFQALEEIIELADRYISDVPFPKKALNILDGVIVYKIRNRRGGSNLILKKEVDALVSERIEIPVGEASQNEKDVLLNLEDIIHQRLVGQEEAVSEIANALRRARADIKDGKRTLGSFLFLGPTGVGKTETAKCLARAYFGSEKKMIRLDMSEYQEVGSINKLIGDGENPGYFTTMIREDPFSLILLDEIDKAHPNILDLFLQILDEGRATDGSGRTVNFRNSIIIATSNAGAELVRDAVKKGRNLSEYKQEFVDEVLKQGLFRPEFLNRFDAIVLFRTLAQDHLQKIARLMLEEIRTGLSQKEIDLVITSELVEKMSGIGFNPEFGAREMRRSIQEKIENIIAKAMLAGNLKTSDRIKIDSETFEIIKIDKRDNF